MYVLLAIETCVLTSEIVSHNSLATYLAIYGSKLISHLCLLMLCELRRMAKDLSEGVRGQIIALTNEGYSQRQVAAKIGVSKGAVQRTLERFRKTGSYSSRPKSGRPRSTTKQEDQFIKLTSLRNRRATAGDIQLAINSTRERPISKATVRRRLTASGLRGRVARSKPFLRPVNKRKRYLWAKKYKNYTVENWKKVLFTDESQFEIHGNNRRVYVRRRHGERFLNQCLKSTIRHGGGSIQVWGCFSFSGVGSLYRIKGILEKKQYHSILQRHAIPSGKRLCGRGFTLVQDNDPKHSSNFCKKYLQNKERQGELKLMDFPPQSPDVNPIEHLWEHLKREKVKHAVTSKDNLWEILSDCWSNIKAPVLQALVKSMPKRVNAV